MTDATPPTPELIALQSAVTASGGQTALARKLTERGYRVRQGHVWAWLHKVKRAPAEAVPHIEAVVNGKVTRHDLRPDVFGPPPAAIAPPAGE